MIIGPIIWRRAVREYSGEPVLEESIEEIIKAAQFAPTAMNKHAVEFVVVEKAAVKNKLFEILQQEFIKKAPVLLVPVCDGDVLALAAADLAVASAFMMIQAAALGLGTVWKHIAPEQTEKIREILQIPKNYVFINLIAVGYPKEELLDHGDSDFDAGKIHVDKF